MVFQGAFSNLIMPDFDDLTLRPSRFSLSHANAGWVITPDPVLALAFYSCYYLILPITARAIVTLCFATTMG